MTIWYILHFDLRASHLHTCPRHAPHMTPGSGDYSQSLRSSDLLEDTNPCEEPAHVPLPRTRTHQHSRRTWTTRPRPIHPFDPPALTLAVLAPSAQMHAAWRLERCTPRDARRCSCSSCPRAISRVISPFLRRAAPPATRRTACPAHAVPALVLAPGACPMMRTLPALDRSLR